MIRVFVGTSGWNYSWNRGGDLRWYLRNTEFNAVELNMSFYRFPYPSLPKHWARIGSCLAWSIKVHRLITHRMRFSIKAFNVWEKFRSIFRPMENAGVVRFYLFQCPPYFRPTPKSVENLERFIDHADLGEMFAIEFRNEEWFNETWEKWARGLGITMVSVDAPEFPGKVFRSSGKIYVRIHGRSAWYHHIYTEDEVVDLLRSVDRKTEGCDELYFFLNNNHGMLPTGNLILRIVEKYIRNAKVVGRRRLATIL